jgi:small subunit ribosomal protein S18
MAYQAEREEVEIKKFIDYKDVAYLKLFTSPHAKMLSKKRTGIPSGKQRDIMQAIKRARYMALLPYVSA